MGAAAFASLQALQMMADKGGLLTYLEGARTLNALHRKEAKAPLHHTASLNFQARRHHREHQMQLPDFMDEGASGTFCDSQCQ